MDRSRYDSATPRTGASRAASATSPSDGQRAASNELPSSAALQQALTEVAHDLNNPLAIISGNAQLLLELARMLELDPDVSKPIQDIEEASHRLAATVSRLNALRETIPDQPLGGDGR